MQAGRPEGRRAGLHILKAGRKGIRMERRPGGRLAGSLGRLGVYDVAHFVDNFSQLDFVSLKHF
jgi:hypothetical protein